ncbi:MAG: glycosyltransferase, partial [Phycisphaerae bacterium]|nr:glycosyltransferase [Phycisphaerae bacterium]
MKILSTTICYPTPSNPNQGLFIRRRLEAIARVADVRVICPVPYFPGYSPRPPRDQPDAPIPVFFPRMSYVPGVLKTLDASFFAHALTRELRTLRASFPFDLIDAHFVWPDGVGAGIVAWKLGVPMVVTVRGKIVSQRRYWLRRRRIAGMLGSVEGRIAVSESLAQEVRGLAGESREVRVIPNGVDASVFHPGDAAEARRALGLPADARVIVSVGQVREIKGFDRLVAAMPEVRSRVGDARLILIGPGIGEVDYERRVRSLVERLGLAGVVDLVGEKRPCEVARYLSAADVFALATRSEGWCNAIQEALAVGAPVVATDVGGNRELVTSDRLGRLVPFGEPEALARALIEALGGT